MSQPSVIDAAPSAVDGGDVEPPSVASPGPRWPGAVPSVPSSTLVGRERDLAALRELLRSPEPAFITLVGVGGVGKSRLAAELAVQDLAPCNGRVASVPLDAVSDPSMVLPAIAGALGIGDEHGGSVADALAEALGAAPTLLVLDTVEHVRPAAPALADLRARTPGLTILATSRVALGVPRERILWVEPLAIPGEAAPDDSIDTVLESASAQLFLDRALAVRPDFELTPANAALVAAICRRLDGLPLAIELAAAALRVLAPHQLLDQLAERMADPAAGSPATGPFADAASPARQRSLRTAMDWSIGLLGEPVLRLYRRLGVIAGVFSASTAASILERGERRGLAPLGIGVGEGLAQLAAASLLRTQGERGYAMLTTVRDDALERLRAAGEAVAMRWAHAYEVLAMVEASELQLPTEREIEALDRLDEAHDDIREALDWAMEQGDGTFAVRMTGALPEFWRTRGHHTEGRLRLASALALAPDAPAPYRRKALGGAGLLASYQGDYVLGESYLREALAAARTDGDEEAEAVILNWLGTNAYGRGDLDAAEVYVSEGLALRRRLGDPAGIATALNALGGVYHFRGELDRAREMFVESLALKQELGNANSFAVSLTNLGLVERDAGRPAEAEGAFEEAIAIWERSGDRQRMAVGIHNAALLALDQHRHEDAAALLDRAYEIARDLGDRTEMAYALADRARVDVERGALDEAAADIAASLPRAVALGARIIVPITLEAAGSLASQRGDDHRAVTLWAAAAAERAASGFANMPADERHLDERMAAVRDRLDPAAFAEAWAEGSALTVDEAVALALPGSRAGR
jgi:predicted ATPase/Tfp pilus assembly protein PilF